MELEDTGPSSFNPRARGGRDLLASGTPSISRVSIHAPAGGATPDTVVNLTVRAVSIHAPAGGATNGTSFGFFGLQVSIHAPAGGAT